MAPPPTSAPPASLLRSDVSEESSEEDGDASSESLSSTWDSAADDARLFEALSDLLSHAHRAQAARLATQAAARPAVLAQRSEDLGETLLHVAATAGALRCCRRLLAAGADVRVCDAIGGGTPLHSVRDVLLLLLLRCF